MILTVVFTAGAVVLGSAIAIVLRAVEPREPLHRRRPQRRHASRHRTPRHRNRRLHVVNTFPHREIES